MSGHIKVTYNQAGESGYERQMTSRLASFVKNRPEGLGNLAVLLIKKGVLSAEEVFEAVCNDDEMLVEVHNA